MYDLNKSKIMELFQFDNAARGISKAYVASSNGHVQTGDVVHLSFPETNGDCHVKSGHIRQTDSYVIKIASGFYDNPSKDTNKIHKHPVSNIGGLACLVPFLLSIIIA